jgi:two-component system, NarL family, nitrate/nitrite response regulator NarL
MSAAKIRVMLVDDHPMLREGVRFYLASRGISVVAEASDAKEALRKAAKLKPDVVVLDINLSGIDGGELARRLRLLQPKTKLLAFSIHTSEEYVVRMARCGVHGYVMKDQPTAELLAAIRGVHEDRRHFPKAMADALAVKPGSSADRAVVLTARELVVLALLADGLSNKAAAVSLGISARTVEMHREHLSRKLGIATIPGLTKYAIAHGLTRL